MDNIIEKINERNLKISDDMAEMMLEAMVTDSAYEFECGVRQYIESERAIKK